MDALRRERMVGCDSCGAMFQMNPVRVELEDGGERTSFSCPQCKREYVLARITGKGVALRAQMRELRTSIAGLEGEARATALRQLEGMQWEFEGEVQVE